MEAQDFIEKLGLKSHPEGGYFCEIYRNNTIIDSSAIGDTYDGERNLATSIYYMLEGTQVSKLHQLKSDELWYFHYGSPLHIHMFFEGQYRQVVLGCDITQNQIPQVIIPAGAIFGAWVENSNGFTLMGCMVTPGFHFNDFKLIGYDDLISQYPNYEGVIKRLT